MTALLKIRGSFPTRGLWAKDWPVALKQVDLQEAETIKKNQYKKNKKILQMQK